MANKKHLMVMALAALLMGSSLGLNFNTIGVFLQPIANSLNVNVGSISQHSTIMSIGMATAAFSIPPVLNRISFRKVILFATLINAVSIFLMSMSTQIWMFNVLGLVRGVSAAFFGVVALQLLINNWFISKHGLVTSIVFSFSGLLGAIFSPIVTEVILAYGWEKGFQFLAVLILIFNAPGILLPYTFSPKEEGLEPYLDETNTEKTEKPLFDEKRKASYSMKSLTFVLLILFAAFVPSLTGLAQHLQGIGLDFGFSATIGAFMISGSMIGNILFKLVIGTLSDYKGTIFALLSMVSTVAVGLLLIYIASSNIVVILGSLLYGAVFSIATVGISLFIRHIYEIKDFQRVFPIVNFITNLGGALAVSFFGYSFDITGSYNFAVLFAFVLMMIGILIILVIHRRTKQVNKIV